MSKPKFERRLMEIRAANNDPDDVMRIEGRAIVFDTPQTYTWGDEEYTEIIASGALDNTDMKDVPLRYNHHDEFLIMARTRNKSLELIKSKEGLDIVSELIDTSSNRDVYTSICNGLIDKMSFAFVTRQGTDKWEYIEEGESLKITRTITDIEKLYDVSVVDMPFYDSTSIFARSFELLDSEKKSRLDEAREFELRKRKLQLQAMYKNF